MKQFLAIYTGTTSAQERSGWDQLSEAQRTERIKQGMTAWMDWGERHKGAIVVQGSPLGKTKRAGMNGVTDIKNAMVGWVVVQAETHEDAAKMFLDHPHFAIFPGDSVEIMECLPIPQL
ncbi:MAG TPA: hypothetical protein VEA80_11400 [Vitreimonas sp.]|uniref:hypothetical protein n=1 Tax=Vitreimonas sp. TaxID=3069702 RepID=UPI002D2E2517|nr:hypothetical protein [Vitreimonas sp.]HYD88073.1 hypothetical protein [Vitreimonas sp.]